MTALTQHSSSNTWIGRVGEFDDADHPIRAFLQEDTGVYGLATTGPEDAACIDWHGDGLVAELVITGSPYVLVDVGGGVISPASSGTVAAILIDDGSGGLRQSTDLDEAEAGHFYLAGNGDLVAVRDDAARLQFIQTGDTIATTL